MKTWMRKRGDRARITTGRYVGHYGTVESFVYQGTVDFPGESAESHRVLLETGKPLKAPSDKLSMPTAEH